MHDYIQLLMEGRDGFSSDVMQFFLCGVVFFFFSVYIQ